ACDGELPAAPGGADRRGAEHRRLAAGLQRHGADLRQRDPVGADEHLRGHLQLRPQAVLRDRRGRARRAAGAVHDPGSAGPCGPPGFGAREPAARRHAAGQLSPRRLIGLCTALVAVAALLPAAAQAKSYALTDANVAVRIQSDGTLLVAESISFLYG